MRLEITTCSSSLSTYKATTLLSQSQLGLLLSALRRRSSAGAKTVIEDHATRLKPRHLQKGTLLSRSLSPRHCALVAGLWYRIWSLLHCSTHNDEIVLAHRQ